MTISTFAVPIDIPWQRIAFSSDMMDEIACDRELPLRWRSSVAVFEYEPPVDQQRIDGFKVSYLKVACSITGYQPSDKEIRIRERLGKFGWTHKDHNEALQAAVGAYYACYGAMLEVVVAPHAEENFALKDYPYFADFDPKKRELYELVTDTGEVMSRSLEDVNVRQGHTTLQSHEVRDKTDVKGAVAGYYSGIVASGAVGGESGTTDITQQATENVRTTDAAREERETFSHTTQLSQMYHLLNSYHLGTNRAAFFVLPRPHVKESPFTFVNGPREIEGIQEFMLVVVRPKEMAGFCVEAYLETAHLTHNPVYDKGETTQPLPLKVNAEIHESDESHFNHVTGANSSTKIVGKVVDTDRGAGGYDTAGSRGYDVLQPIIAVGLPPAITFTVSSDHVDVTAIVSGFYDEPDDTLYPASLDLNAVVYYKNEVPAIVGYTDGLLITARAVCSCPPARILGVEYEKGLSVVYEKQIGKLEVRPSRERASIPIAEANRLQLDIHREMLHSLSSADRYPRGTVSLLDTQMVAGMLSVSLSNANPEVNKRLAHYPGIDEELVRRVTQYVPSITRSKLLEMPLARQVENFGLTFAEAVALRRSLADIEVPKGPPPVPQRPKVRVPLLTGLTLREARQLLAGVGLRLGGVATVDSPLPAGAIVTQTPGEGDDVASDTEIVVEIASGLSVRLPEIIGLRLTEAGCGLRNAGLRSEPTIEGRPSPNARIAEIEPPAGTLVTPNASVTLRLRRS
jgi:hypothetical protein